MTTTSFTLHDLPAPERPRERLVAHGVSTLSTLEILALILGRGIQGQPVMQLAQELLKRYGSIRGISEASLDDLQQVHGMGLAKAAQVQACIEVGRRLAAELVANNQRTTVLLDSPGVVAELVRQKMGRFKREHYFLISLDARNRFIGIDKVSEGVLDASLVHPRETFEMAIRRHAAKIVVAHNHPSGDPTPSDDDVIVTKRLNTAGKVLGIALVDHVVVADGSFYSFKEHGQI